MNPMLYRPRARTEWKVQSHKPGSLTVVGFRGRPRIWVTPTLLSHENGPEFPKEKASCLIWVCNPSLSLFGAQVADCDRTRC